MKQHDRITQQAADAALALEAFDLVDDLRRFHRRRTQGDFRAPNGMHNHFVRRCEAVLQGHLQQAVKLRKEGL